MASSNQAEGGDGGARARLGALSTGGVISFSKYFCFVAPIPISIFSPSTFDLFNSHLLCFYLFFHKVVAWMHFLSSWLEDARTAMLDGCRHSSSNWCRWDSARHAEKYERSSCVSMEPHLAACGVVLAHNYRGWRHPPGRKSC